MFTGIVRAVGTASLVSSSTDQLTLSVTTPTGFCEGIEGGESVAVDGVCLTVASVREQELTFDVIQETLERTTLGSASLGARMNLERSLRFGDEIGGHVLSGHVSCTAEVTELVQEGGVFDLLLQVESESMRYILEKGFIAIDGISLTVGKTNSDSGTFWLHLIPETLERTTIMGKDMGSRVNVEFDSQTVATVNTIQRIHGVG